MTVAHKAYKRVNLLIFAVIASCFLSAAYAITPTEALTKCKSKIESSGNLAANFTFNQNSRQTSGKITTKGSKFAITAGGVSNWYNGKDLYTYNSAKGETTIFKPNASELTSVNPLRYLSTFSQYNVMGSRQDKKGEITAVLVPKKTGGAIKSVTIQLDAKTFLPKLIKITPSTGGPVEVSISNITLNGNVSDSAFEYPASKYPNAQINDMR